MDASDSPANPDFREDARREDGTRWNYAYNARSEVTGASKRTAANNQIPAMSFGYEYDGIGNRTKAWSGTDASVSSPTWGYTSNALNQYTGITYSGRADILTRSDATVNATVTGAAAGTVATEGQFHGIPLTRASADATHGRLSSTTVRRSGVAQTPDVTTWLPPANRTVAGSKLGEPRGIPQLFKSHVRLARQVCLHRLLVGFQDQGFAAAEMMARGDVTGVAALLDELFDHAQRNLIAARDLFAGAFTAFVGSQNPFAQIHGKCGHAGP